MSAYCLQLPGIKGSLKLPGVDPYQVELGAPQFMRSENRTGGGAYEPYNRLRYVRGHCRLHTVPFATEFAMLSVILLVWSRLTVEGELLMYC